MQSRRGLRRRLARRQRLCIPAWLPVVAGLSPRPTAGRVARPGRAGCNPAGGCDDASLGVSDCAFLRGCQLWRGYHPALRRAGWQDLVGRDVIPPGAATMPRSASAIVHSCVVASCGGVITPPYGGQGGKTW